VYAVAYRIARRTDVADDVAQETFLRAYRALDRFEAGRPFGPWVARIAANLAINRKRSPLEREQGLPDGHAEAPSSAPDPLGRLLETEAGAVLEKAVAELPEDQRAVFVLRIYEDLSYNEIAEALGLVPGTVMSRLSRARARLRNVLLPYLTPSRAAAEGSKV
jgi:RNA polymerase sigma-70 factor (ECF subfamily)